MQPKQFYKFCPKCGAKTTPAEHNYLICTKCGFKNFINVASTVGALIENENGEILLVKRKFDPGKGEWDIPGGFISPDEDLEEAIIREIKEELGVKIKMGKIIGGYKDIYSYQGLNVPILGLIVSAKIISGELQSNDDVSDYQFVLKDKLKDFPLWCPSIRRGLEEYLKQPIKLL